MSGIAALPRSAWDTNYNYADYIGGLCAGRRLDLNLYSGFQLQGLVSAQQLDAGMGPGPLHAAASAPACRRISRPGGRAWCSATCSPAASTSRRTRCAGMLVGSDTAMLPPYSERLNRPTIRGVARTRANVKVYQAGMLVFPGRRASRAVPRSTITVRPRMEATCGWW